MNYPWIREDALSYGIIKVSVANMRAHSVFQSELVNQTLMGTIVSILDKRDDFYLIQNWDGYIGWVNKHEISIGDIDFAREWEESEKIMITENYGQIHSLPETKDQILSDLVPCIFLKKLSDKSHYIEIELVPRTNIHFFS